MAEHAGAAQSSPLVQSDSGDLDEHATVREAMRLHRGMAETSYRALATMVVDLESIICGRPTTSEPLRLGELRDRLLASDSQASRVVGQAYVPALRNVDAHSHFALDESCEEIVDLRGGQRWPVEEAAEIMLQLTRITFGIDIGFACFVVGEGIELDAKRTLIGRARTFTYNAIAGITFGGMGYTVSSVEDAGATVVLAGEQEPSPPDLVAPLAGLLALEEAPSYRVLFGEKRTLVLDVDGETITAARDAPDELKGMAVIRVLHSDALRKGQQPAEARRHLLSLLTRVLARTALDELKQAGEVDRAGFSARLAYVRYLFESLDAGEDPALAGLAVLLDEAQALVVESRDSRKSEVEPALQALDTWAEDVGVVWPPRWEAPPT